MPGLDKSPLPRPKIRAQIAPSFRPICECADRTFFSCCACPICNQLIDGLLVAKMTQNPPHTISDDLCGQSLARVVPGWYIRPAKPVRLPGQATMNEPDRCVVRGQARNYQGQHPGPADIVLVVEVADSRLP